MFVRMKTVQSAGREYKYVKITRSRREGAKVLQEVVGNLGRYDDLLAAGDVEQLVEELAALCRGLRVASARGRWMGRVAHKHARGAGPLLGRLWDDLGLRALLEEVGRRHGFPEFGRGVFALGLYGLLGGRRGRDAAGWAGTVRGEG